MKFNSHYRYLKFNSYNDYERYSSNSQSEWTQGIGLAREEFKSLLDTHCSEQKVQDFLERHPYFLPGFGDLHHGPYEGIVSTKFHLGLDFVTDFAFVCSNSQTLCLTCVEIESPQKRLFRTDGKFHRDYIDARQQIIDWLGWANNHKRQAFDQWGSLFSSQRLSDYDISFRAFLVFGRREQIDDPTKQHRWSAEAGSLHSNLQIMTYDRLLLNYGAIWYDVDNKKLAVCAYKDRKFFAKHIIS